MNESEGLVNFGLRKSDVVVIALYNLGGSLHYIHLEDVAMKSAELSPKSFSWKKYPEQINLESVRINLKNELEGDSPRVIGSIRGGWMLTVNGVLWCLGKTAKLCDPSMREQILSEARRAKQTTAFKKAIDDKLKDITPNDVDRLLRIDQYFSERNRKERVTALANAAVLDGQLGTVLTKLIRTGFSVLEVNK